MYVCTRTWLIEAEPTGCVRLKLLNSSSTGSSSSLDSTFDTRLAAMGGTSSWSFLPTKRRRHKKMCTKHTTHTTRAMKCDKVMTPAARKREGIRQPRQHGHRYRGKKPGGDA